MQPCETSNRNGTLQGIDVEALEVRWQAVANPQSLSPKERLNILGHAPAPKRVRLCYEPMPNIAKSRGGMEFLEGVGSRAGRVMRAGRIFWGGGVRFGGGTSKAHKTTTNGGGPVVSRASVVF